MAPSRDGYRDADPGHPVTDGPGTWPDRDEPLPGSARADLRLVAPALCAWAVAWAVLAVPHPIAWGIGAALGGLAAWGAHRKRWLLAGCALVGLSSAVCALAQTELVGTSLLAQAGRDHAVVEVVATVRSDPREFGARAGLPPAAVVRVSVQQAQIHGQTSRLRVPAELVASGDRRRELMALGVGQRITVLGKASEPSDRTRATAARIAVSSAPRILAPPGPLDTVLNRVRAALVSSMSASTPEQAGLVPALVVGDVSGLSSSLEADFKTAGLTHLTAVSGTNLTLMLIFVLSCARMLGVRGWALRTLAFPVVIGFIVLCRSEPSVVRAAAMGLVALAATGRRGVGPPGLRQLSVAVWVLVLADPWLARSWGFALSAAATGGILCWAGRWQRRMRRWAGAWLAESICVPLAAQIATQPLVTALSGSVSMSAVAANALVAPFVGPVTVLGMAAGAAGVVLPSVGVALGWLAGWCAETIILVAHRAADLPATTLSWPATPLAVMVLCAMCAALAWLIDRLIARPLLCLLLALAAVGACLWRPQPPGWPDDWTVISCDVGQGDATLVRTGPTTAILVDTGPEPDAMAGCLRNSAITRVALLVISHFHADHVGGLDGVYRVARVDAALINPLASPVREAARVRETLAGHATPMRSAAAGDRFGVGTASWQTLQAAAGAAGTAGGAVKDGVGPTGGEGESAAENDSSILGRISVPGLSVLVTGDMGASAQRIALASGLDLHADVLKVPHHGSADQDEDFLAATGARVALVSAGKDNGYGHPTPRTLARLARHAMTTARTDQQGDVAVRQLGEGRLQLVSRR